MEVQARLGGEEIDPAVLLAARLPLPGRTTAQRQPVLGRGAVLAGVCPRGPVGTRVTSDRGGFPRKPPLAGLAKNVASAEIVYNHDPLSARFAAHCRSAFVCASQVSCNFQTVCLAAGTALDCQAACRVTHHLSAVWQVLNPTDQPTRTDFGSPQETSTLQCFGHTLYAGFSLRR